MFDKRIDFSLNSDSLHSRILSHWWSRLCIFAHIKHFLTQLYWSICNEKGRVKTQSNINFTIAVVTNVKDEKVFLNENLHHYLLLKVSRNTLPFSHRTAYSTVSQNTHQNLICLWQFSKLEVRKPPPPPFIFIQKWVGDCYKSLKYQVDKNFVHKIMKYL